MKPIILLTGDSIIDNAYWNDVEKDTTAEYLRKMNLRVIDRATEEITATRFFQDSKGIVVSNHYVKSRKNKGIPYDGFYDNNNVFRVKPVPESNVYEWWSTPVENRYVVLSLGGNDLVLMQNYDINNIKKKLKKVIKKLINDTKINSKNLLYVIPYPPNKGLSKILEQMFLQRNLDITPKKFYKSWTNKTKKMCKKLGISYISLEDFTSKDKGPDDARIPEPTKQGAEKIAIKINDFIIGKILSDYKLLLKICKNQESHLRLLELPKNVLRWVYNFSKYAIKNGSQLKINNDIVSLYEELNKNDEHN